jgi:hypothetical protein
VVSHQNAFPFDTPQLAAGSFHFYTQDGIRKLKTEEVSYQEHSVILTLFVVAVDNARIPDRRCRYTSRIEALTSDCC